MNTRENLIELNEKILKIKEIFGELEEAAGYFPAVNRNSKRALASLKMLELNISDLVEFDLV
jgi:hypothetical protein